MSDNFAIIDNLRLSIVDGTPPQFFEPSTLKSEKGEANVGRVRRRHILVSRKFDAPALGHGFQILGQRGTVHVLALDCLLSSKALTDFYTRIRPY